MSLWRASMPAAATTNLCDQTETTPRPDQRFSLRRLMRATFALRPSIPRQLPEGAARLARCAMHSNGPAAASKAASSRGCSTRSSWCRQAALAIRVTLEAINECAADVWWGRPGSGSITLRVKIFEHRQGWGSTTSSGSCPAG